ncbi:50S ribosomal protein L25/general stress protein Ctc [Aliikangiella maris]|uniref:Large ribosomal subunit protein bL25 n=2 Tax=Aliikangiella maris TaxID=3162458 RepID=A0ABV2BSF6_9GAMM
MSESFELNVEIREDMGKGASRRLRRLEGKVPGIIYGAGKEPQTISVIHSEIIKHLEEEAFYSHVLTLNVNGTPESVILKDLQRHPYKPKINHVDFLRIKAGEKLQTTVPLHFLNEETGPGAKAGGVINHTISAVEVSCLPKDLPEFIEVDLGALEMDQVIHLSDLQLPNGVELVELALGEDHDQAVVTIHKGRSAKSDEESSDDSAE